MKHLLSIILLMLFSWPVFSQAGQDDPAVIFNRAVDRILTEKAELSMHLDITDSKGRISEKAYDILMASFGDRDLIRMTMQLPERAKGITIVITQPAEGDGIIEVFTPSNGKVRKMLATPENLDRVGSSFILADYASETLEEMDFTYLGEGALDGKACFLLEARDAKNPEGKIARFTIEQQSYYIREIDVLNEAGELISSTGLSGFQAVENLEGKVYPMEIHTKNLAEASETQIRILKASHRSGLTEEEFRLKSAQPED